MDTYEYGSCSKKFMDSIPNFPQKTIKLLEFCIQYKLDNNFITLYYLKLNEQMALMWIIIISIIIIAVTLTKRLLDLFLAKFVISIKKRHDLSPFFVGTIFLPICYQLRETFYISDNQKTEPFDLYYTYISNLSCYIHYLTIPFVFLLLKDAKTEILPRDYVNLSLLFIFVIILTQQIVGIFASVNYYTCGIFLFIGVIYFVLVAFMTPKNNARYLTERAKWTHVDTFTQQVADQDRVINDVVFKDSINIKDIKKRETGQKQQKSVVYRIIQQIWSHELSLLDNCLQSPIILVSLFTTPYPKNPLMKTVFRYYILYFGSYLGLTSMFEISNFYITSFLSLLILLTYFILEAYAENQRYIKTFIEIISIVQAQALLSLIVRTMGDAFFFVPFALSMNRSSTHLIISSLLMSYPRVMYGYVLLKNGQFMTMAISYFSCWIFQTTILFAKDIALNYSHGNIYMDLYNNKDPFIEMPFGFGRSTQKFIITLHIILLALLAAQSYYFNSSRTGAPNKRFAKSMLAVWLVYMAYGFWFGLTQIS